MISHEHKAIFIHIPKNAGMSIEKALGGNLKRIHRGPNRGKHGTPNDKKYKKTWKNLDYFKFCFVRNPFDRVVSAYEYDHKMSFVKGYAMRKKGADTARRLKVRSLGKEGFNIFIESFYKKMKKKAPPVWYKRQQFWIRNFKYDFIGRVENIDKDFQIVCDELGIENKLEKINTSDRSYYKEYYNEKSISIISDYYSKDIQRFNYSF
jgi:hypothetical protein